MAKHYQATIVWMRLSNIASNCVEGLRVIKNQTLKREIVNKIRADLIEIMKAAVKESVDHFGRRTGTMEKSLYEGIQVKGVSPKSITAILHGVEYTLVHENDTKIEPHNAKMLAIPLRDACWADGRPKKSGPLSWRSRGTFIISGERAAKMGLREPLDSDINPHGPEDVAYIAYRNKKENHLVFLYKLVPYSLFYKGYTNIYGTPLKKLGLRQRLYAALESAWDSWGEYILGKMNEAQDWQALEAYKGVYVGRTFVEHHTSYNVPKGAVRETLKRTTVEKLTGFIDMADKAGRM